MIKRFFALAGLSFLCACSDPLPLTQPPIAITPTDTAALGVDVYSEMRKTNTSLPAFKGETQVTLRTYVDPEGSNNRKEVAARCDVKGGTLFTAEGTTPLTLILPNYGQTSLTMSAECLGDAGKGFGTHGPYNVTMARVRQNVNNAAATGGLLGALVGIAVSGVISAANDPTNDEYGYRPWKIVLK